MAKRANGDGTVRKRKDGRWEAMYSENGKRHSKYFKTKGEASEFLRGTVAEIDEGTHVEETRMTVGEWMDIYLNTFCMDVKPSTRQGYEGVNRRYILPDLGEVRLSKLTHVHLQEWINKLSDKLSPKTVQNAHGIFHKALQEAQIAGYLKTNPSDHLHLPKAKKPELTPLMDMDIPMFLQAAEDDPYYPVYFVALFSGMRFSELMGLQWDCVNMNTGIILVRRQLQYVNNQYQFIESPKNSKPRRVAVAKSVTDMLRRVKSAQDASKLRNRDLWENDRNLVFTDEIGRHLNHQTVYHHFKKIVASIGRPECRFHDLRHSYAIAALQNGESIKVIQEQLGHYSSAFTMDTYAAVSDTMQKQSQDRMEKFIKKALG